jgi:hypothetical protein
MEIKSKMGSVDAMLRQQAVECRGEPMAGRFRQIRGHDEGIPLPLPASLPECHAPLGSGDDQAEADGSSLALSPSLKPTLALAC